MMVTVVMSMVMSVVMVVVGENVVVVMSMVMMVLVGLSISPSKTFGSHLVEGGY